MDGSELRDKGMKQAADNADRVVPSWGDDAVGYLERFLKRYSIFTEFQAEHVRHWAHNNGLPMPPDARAWGMVMKRAKKFGLVEFVRWDRCHDRKVHMCPAAVWRKVKAN